MYVCAAWCMRWCRGVARLPIDWSNKPFCDQWLRFERECGTLDDLIAAQLRLEKRAKETEAKHTKVAEKEAAAEQYAEQLAEEKTARRAAKRKNQAAQKRGFGSAAEADSYNNTNTNSNYSNNNKKGGDAVTFGNMSLGESKQSVKGKGIPGGGRRGLGAGRVDANTNNGAAVVAGAAVGSGGTQGKKNARKQPEPSTTNNDIKSSDGSTATVTNSTTTIDDGDARGAKRRREGESVATASMTAGPDLPPSGAVIAGPFYGPEMPSKAVVAGPAGPPTTHDNDNGGNISSTSKKGGKAARLEKQEAKRKQWEQEQMAAIKSSNNDDDHDYTSIDESEDGNATATPRVAANRAGGHDDERAPRIPNPDDDKREHSCLTF
jgi:hypothetical protein